MRIVMDVGLSTLCNICGFACQKMVLNTFLSPGYLRSRDEVVWLWHFLVNLHIDGSLIYLAMAQSHCLVVIGEDGGLSTLYHSCGITCQQRMLKSFIDRVYLHSEDGLVWLKDFFVNLQIFCSTFYLATA